MTEVERLRLFVAVTIPEPLLIALEEQTRSLRTRWTGARWTEMANQHVTLKFLGPTPSDRLGAVASAVALAARSQSAGGCELTGLGAFPSLKRARVLWAGLDDPGGVLAGVAADLERALEPLGYPAESRPFHPHLTLARFKVPQRLGELPELSWPDAGFEVEEIHLFRSRLHPKGARYEILGTFPLGRG